MSRHVLRSCFWLSEGPRTHYQFMAIEHIMSLHVCGQWQKCLFPIRHSVGCFWYQYWLALWISGCCHIPASLHIKQLGVQQLNDIRWTADTCRQLLLGRYSLPISASLKNQADSRYMLTKTRGRQLTTSIPICKWWSGQHRPNMYTDIRPIFRQISSSLSANNHLPREFTATVVMMLGTLFKNSFYLLCFPRMGEKWHIAKDKVINILAI